MARRFTRLQKTAAKETTTCTSDAHRLEARTLPLVGSPSLDPSEANEPMGEAPARQGEDD